MFYSFKKNFQVIERINSILMICLKAMDAVKLWRSGKESTWQCRRCKRHGFDPWVGKISGVGNGNPFQYSCLGKSMNTGAWLATVHRVSELDMTE